MKTEEQQQVTPEQIQDATKQAIATIPRARKFDMFIQLCQQGQSVAAALKNSGLIEADTHTYNPATDSEVELEEVLFARCGAKLDLSRPEYPNAIIPDEKYDPTTFKPGDLTISQLYKLVDWLHFVRGLPLKSIGGMLKIKDKDVMAIKAELMSEFSKSMRQQNAESYIGELLRTKDLLRADLIARRSRLTPRDTQAAIRLDQLLWELENKFFDRLQEIGLINKSLGKIDVHEEWHVTIDAAGQPRNTKLEQVSQEPFIEAEVLPQNLQSDDSESVEKSDDFPHRPERLLEAATQISGHIKVGD